MSAVVLAGLPTYDLGPGLSAEEVVVNVVIYGSLGALLLTILWLGWLARLDRADARDTAAPPAEEPIATPH